MLRNFYIILNIKYIKNICLVHSQMLKFDAAGYSVDKTFRVNKIIDFNRTASKSYSTFFLTPVPASKMGLFHT